MGVHEQLSTPHHHHDLVEPYVMAADVYALAPHTGRGGWTWYTSSSWSPCWACGWTSIGCKRSVPLASSPSMALDPGILPG